MRRALYGTAAAMIHAQPGPRGRTDAGGRLAGCREAASRLLDGRGSLDAGPPHLVVARPGPCREIGGDETIGRSFRDGHVMSACLRTRACCAGAAGTRDARLG